MTTDTTALQERIARAIYEAETPSPRYQWAALRNEAKDRRRQQAAAVLPIIAAEVRAAKADAILMDGFDTDRLLARIARLEAQTDIRGRAVVIYRERAREAEAERDEWRQTALDERGAALDALEQIKARDKRIQAVLAVLGLEVGDA